MIGPLSRGPAGIRFAKNWRRAVVSNHWNASIVDITHDTRRYAARGSAKIPGHTTADEHDMPPDVPPPKRFFINTLDPAKLTSTDWIDLSEQITYLKIPRLKTKHGSSDSRVVIHPQGGPTYTGDTGFLYYHRPDPSHAPALTGEIRFRVTPTSDPASFAAGHDRTDVKTGMPWTISLPRTIRFHVHRPLAQLLLRDKLVTPKTMKNARPTIHGSNMDKRIRVGVTPRVYAFGQPFVIYFSLATHHFTFVDNTRLVLFGVTNLTTVVLPADIHRPLKQVVRPFTGSALCCFEPYTLPQAPGKRFVAIRILKILATDPVRLDPSYAGPELPSELFPREGGLLSRLRYNQVLPWLGNVDKARVKPAMTARPVTAGMFEILFQNEKRYGTYRRELL